MLRRTGGGTQRRRAFSFFFPCVPLHCNSRSCWQAARKPAGGGRAYRKTYRQKNRGQKNWVCLHLSVPHFSVCLSCSVVAVPRCVSCAFSRLVPLRVLRRCKCKCM